MAFASEKEVYLTVQKVMFTLVGLSISFVSDVKEFQDAGHNP